MNKLTKRLFVAVAATAVMAQGAFCLAGSGSDSRNGSISNNVQCWANVYYTNTNAVATTQISSEGSVTTTVTAYCSGASVGQKKTYGSANDSLVAEATALNSSGTVIDGTYSTHSATHTLGSWSTSISVGENW